MRFKGVNFFTVESDIHILPTMRDRFIRKSIIQCSLFSLLPCTVHRRSFSVAEGASGTHYPAYSHKAPVCTNFSGLQTVRREQAVSQEPKDQGALPLQGVLL